MKNTLIILVILLALTKVKAQNKSFIIPFSDEANDKTVDIQLAKGDVTVEGTDRKDVLVKYSIKGEKKSQHTEGKNGMKKISGGSISLEAKEKNNRISIESQHWGSDISIHVQVPKQVDIQVQKNIGDNIIVRNIIGDVNAETNTGNVQVENVSGTVNASSNTGKIHVVIDEISKAKAMQFFSTTGDIDLTIPADSKFNFKMKTDWGDIYSDLDMSMNNSPKEMDKSELTDGTYRMVTDAYTRGSINGGGPEILLNAKMGNIYIRKR